MVPEARVAVEAVIDPGGFEVGDIDIAVGVIGHLAGHERRAAKLGGGDHGVAGTAATGVAGLDQVAFQVAQQFALARLVDQGHQAFLNIHLCQLASCTLISVSTSAAPMPYAMYFFIVVLHCLNSARYYPDSTLIKSMLVLI